MSTSETTDVAIVGAGPAGLTLAERLAVQGLRVLVLDRDTEPGGVPRHSDHPGYGLRDLHRFIGSYFDHIVTFIFTWTKRTETWKMGLPSRNHGRIWLKCFSQ